MAAGIINLQKASGGITKISSADGIGITELVVPESGELATKDSPAFTGTPTAPTPAVETNNTQIATTAFVRSIIPAGVILMWSGSIASIPAGWVLCNGANGTPDLRNRFVVGAGSSYGVGGTGGSKDAVVVAHTHTGSTNTDGAHSHVTYSASDSYGVGDQSTSWFDTGGNDEQTRYDKTSGATNTAGAHTHSLTIASTGSDGTNANLPPYYALAYIMKL